MKFTFANLELPGLMLIEHERFEDTRGAFAESYREDVFREAGLPSLVQDNHSRSVGGVVRGLHYQLRERGMAKLVRCIRGAVLDVAVDIRRGSPTYGKWVGVELTENNKRMLWIPHGFAHGFAALTNEADLFYKMDQYYSPAHDRGIRWNDPAIGVRWPFERPLLSAKDDQAPLLADAENDFEFQS